MEESKKLSAYELARRLVERDVLLNVSSMVDDLGKILPQLDHALLNDLSVDEDDVQQLLGAEPNYQEAAEAAGWVLLPDSEHTQFWTSIFVQTHPGGSYRAACEARGWELDSETDADDGAAGDYEYEFTRVVAGERQREVVLANDSDDAWEALAKKLDLPEQVSFETDAADSDAWKELCEYDSIDTDDYRPEVFEHWAISDWLARRLAERGEVTGDLWNLTVWGRCCTGQAIALDHVIQQIAIELWPDEYSGKEMPYSE